MGLFIQYIASAIRFSTVFLFGATGETITEKSGHLNMGIPGIMCIGGLGGCVGVSLYTHAVGTANINAFLVVLIGIVMALIFSGLTGLLFAFFTVTLRCNQNVTGLTITTFGIGLNSFFLERIGNATITSAAEFSAAGSKYIHLFPSSFYSKLGWFGQIFLSHGFLVYLAIIIALVAAFIIRKTRLGLSLRAVGENAATADAAGINVSRYRYWATIIGAAIAGLGGLFYLMDYNKGSFEYTIDTYGWMAVALVIFTMWKPDLGILGSFVFGALYVLPNYISVGFAAKEIVKIIPYIVTIIVLVLTSVINKFDNQAPANLGISYFREDR